MKPIAVCSQNMTEGAVTDEMRAASLVFTQERPSSLTMRRGLRRKGRRMKHWFPVRDRHQSISWDVAIFTVTDMGWTRFHRSGKAEGWTFASPARGAIWVEGHLTQEPDVEFGGLGFWALNSWGKDNAEGPARRRVVEDLSLPVVNKILRKWAREGRTVIAAADANNIHWDGDLSGLTQIKSRGLDRAWISDDGALELDGQPWEGSKTGKGRDLQHASVNFRLKYRPKKEKR